MFKKIKNFLVRCLSKPLTLVYLKFSVDRTIYLSYFSAVFFINYTIDFKIDKIIYFYGQLTTSYMFDLR